MVRRMSGLSLFLLWFRSFLLSRTQTNYKSCPPNRHLALVRVCFFFSLSDAWHRRNRYAASLFRGIFVKSPFALSVSHSLPFPTVPNTGLLPALNAPFLTSFLLSPIPKDSPNGFHQDLFVSWVPRVSPPSSLKPLPREELVYPSFFFSFSKTRLRPPFETCISKFRAVRHVVAVTERIDRIVFFFFFLYANFTSLIDV